jgi:catechol 2,3-dioxygenase-like lactoylglutathione lyase family enzyme
MRSIRTALLLALTLGAGGLSAAPWLHAQPSPATAGAPATLARVDAVDAVGITVSDLDRAVAFYSGVLTFEKVSAKAIQGPEWNAFFGLRDARAKVVTMKLGDERIELLAFGERGRPIPKDSRSNDRWFQHIAIIVSDMDNAHGVLVRRKVPGISAAPQRLPEWNPNAGGIHAYYFRDPDGHALEILDFPPDKGDPRWHRTHRLFLGIDHTAITVADTEQSLRFYRDSLGMKVKGESLNHGPEQEALNDVPGARLRITSVGAAKGPAVEFLEYLEPRTGRPMPADLRANDLAAWRIIGTVAGRAPALVRDPDGHLLHLRPR